MERGRLGSIGGLFLAGYLIITGGSFLLGGDGIPAQFVGCLLLRPVD